MRCITVVPAPDGAETYAGLWIGTYNAGVSYFDRQGWTTYRTSDGLVDPDVYSIAVAPDSSVWFATYFGQPQPHVVGQRAEPSLFRL